jgi:hypothetical protein
LISATFEKVAEIKLRENIEGFGSSIPEEAESVSLNTAVTSHWFAMSLASLVFLLCAYLEDENDSLVTAVVASRFDTLKIQ